MDFQRDKKGKTKEPFSAETMKEQPDEQKTLRQKIFQPTNIAKIINRQEKRPYLNVRSPSRR